jgi:hypothetical protein
LPIGLPIAVGCAWGEGARQCSEWALKTLTR